MGNSDSRTDVLNEVNSTIQDDLPLSTYDSNEKILDLAILFDPKLLQHAVDKIKELSNKNPLQKHYAPLIRWLEERQARGMESLTMQQFVDSITNKDVARDTAVRVFQQFDVEGSGVVDIDYLHEMLTLSNSLPSGFAGLKDDLKTVNKLLRACTLTPAFVDAFTDGKDHQVNHSQRLSKFLFNNRASCISLCFPKLKRFVKFSDMRTEVLAAHLHLLRDEVQNKKEEPTLQSDEILKPMNKCFSTIEVSSNKTDASKLIDKDFSTYWQSDGPNRSHWIRLTILPNVVIKLLSVYVVSHDQSYMPNHIVVYGGSNESNLRELVDLLIPKHTAGDFTLLENLKVQYQFIKISIKRCHNDGCDTRIRQVKAVGYRVVKSCGVSVIDATAMWYLSVLASTAQAALPVAPQLREAILLHTRTSLLYMPALSLSPSSSEKPSFLSTNIMKQMEKFLQTIVYSQDSVRPEDLLLLLEFAIVCGSLGTILHVLKLVHQNIQNDFPAVSLMRSLKMTEQRSLLNHGCKLAVTVIYCDGGGPDPCVVLNENSKSSYQTLPEKKKCNFVFAFKSGNHIQLTNVVLKLSTAGTSAKRGMVFVLKDMMDEEQLFSSLKKYDDWSEEDYKFSKNSGESMDPVAYFNVDKDWTDWDVTVERIRIGCCVVVKFLEPHLKSADCLSVIGIAVHGYERNPTENHLHEDLLIDDNQEFVRGTDLFLKTIQFLFIMSEDAVVSKSRGRECSHEKDLIVDITDVTMQQLWNVYKLLNTDNCLPMIKLQLCRELLISLLHITLPYFLPDSPKLRDEDVVKKDLHQSHEYSDQVFQSMCSIVDGDNARLHKLAKAVIIDGAEVFFPDVQTRKSRLLSLVEKVMDNSMAMSLTYTFESLCRFFSHKDASGLLGLPQSLPDDTFQPDSVVHVMKTLLCVAYKQCITMLNSAYHHTCPTNLVLLLSAMQKGLLAWSHLQCTTSSAQNVAMCLLTNYVELISFKSNHVFEMLFNQRDVELMLDKLEFSFVSVTLRQLVLFLNLYAQLEVDCVNLLRHLQPLAQSLERLSCVAKQFFALEYYYDTELIVLREWRHTSDRDASSNKVFQCSGASSFKVDFFSAVKKGDSYAYIEFTDSTGSKRRFEETAQMATCIIEGTSFEAGQKLLFLVHSDDSQTTTWEYSFKVSALGSPDFAVSWIFDLQLSLSKCFGIICSSSLDSSKAFSKRDGDTNDEERTLLHNELWSSLFRGGLVGKLERSLSGFHRSNPSDCSNNLFLNAMATGNSQKATEFVTRCRSLYKGHIIGGGELMDSTVNAVFSALIWHTQELRDKVTNVADDTQTQDVLLCFLNAYASAENIRRPLLERRQRLIIEGEVPTNMNPVSPDSPLINCREKALFLLKFAGLSKLLSRKQSSYFGFERKHSMHNRSSKIIAHQECYEPFKNGSMVDDRQDKFPSFQMVLEFVLNSSVSHTKIQALLHHRSKYAKSVANVYLFAKEQVIQKDITGSMLLFLQNLLSLQDCLPSHYSDLLNGCGLELENRVRRAYYDFVHSLTSIITSKRSPMKHPYLLAYLLHLFQTNWKPFDYMFLLQLQFPRLLTDVLAAALLISNNRNEQKELEMFERHMQFFEAANRYGIKEWCKMNRDNVEIDTQRDINLFIARYSADLEVEVTCDGCSKEVKGRRHRCLECTDLDICTECFNKRVKLKDHSEQHEVIDLRISCNNCGAFIVETRIHCNICDDFDLCLGCYHHQKFPPCHEKSHSITKSRISALGSFPSQNSSHEMLMMYIYHQSWMQYSALMLSLSECLQNKNMTETDAEYLKSAAELFFTLLKKIVVCLNSEEELYKGTPTDPYKQFDSNLQSDSYFALKTFSPERPPPLEGDNELHETSSLELQSNKILQAVKEAMQHVVEEVVNRVEVEDGEEKLESNEKSNFHENVLSLIGAVLPAAHTMFSLEGFTDFPVFVSKELIPMLIKIIRSKSKKDQLRMLAIGVFTKLTAIFSPEVIDAGFLGDSMLPGELTVWAFFQIGAQCLPNANINVLSGVNSLLRSLYGNSSWKQIVGDYVNVVLEDLADNKKALIPMSLFVLMFLANFPEILRVGSTVLYKEPGKESRQVIIEDRQGEQVLVRNLKTRKTMFVQESLIEDIPSCQQMLSSDSLTFLLAIVIESLAAHKGVSLSMEKMWILGLTCKALLHSLSPNVSTDFVMKIIDSGAIPLLINLACQGMTFSKQWLLKDLEIFGWKMLTQRKKEDSVETLPEKPRSPLDGLDEQTKVWLVSMHEALNYSYPILRAMYEFFGQDRDKLLEEVQRSYGESDNVTVSDEILALAKRWESKDNPSVPAVDSCLDTGKLKFQPHKSDVKDLKAKPEPEDNPKKLVTTLTDEELHKTQSKQRSFKSAQLLKDQLKKTCYKDLAKEVYHAIAVGYSRRLVGCLFAFWPACKDVYPMLGNIDSHQIVGLLDLIQCNETKEHVKKVVYNFIRCCSQPLALSAVQCMGEVHLPTATRESDHKYKNNVRLEDKVTIAGATSLFIRFDERCSTEYNCDELVMASSSDYQQNKMIFSGTSDWQDFEMPGDTIYYRFTSDTTNNDWGWKFVVSGGQLGRFETGCMILNALLSQDLHTARKLPLKQLWSWLIIVACNHVGQQRLMTTGLLLRILQITAGDKGLFGSEAKPIAKEKRPVLSILRPLWLLYTKSIESDTGTSLALLSPVIRGLSELFLIAENVAQDWGEADCLVAGLATEDKLRKCISKIVHNIAAIGLAIGVPNKAVQMCLDAKLPSMQNVCQEKNTRKSKTVSLRITTVDSSDEDGMLFDDEEGFSQDDDSDTDMSSDLSEPDPLIF